MTFASLTLLLSLLLLEASGSFGDLESCATSQGDAEAVDGWQLLHIRANQKNSGEVETQSIHDHEAGTSIAAEYRKIYTYWDYGNDPLPMIALNVQTWLKHAPPDTELVLVNESNFRDLIPDAPEELFRLPYAAAKSDIVRAAVLYHHGGLYLDTDFVVMKPLSNIFEKLAEGWDVVAYADNPAIETGECDNNDFTSNFMAARRGNVVSGTWWENIKTKLTRTCDVGGDGAEKVCCREAFSGDLEFCHIPWGHLEWLKNPVRDADASSYHSPPTAISRRLGAGIGGPEMDAVLAAIVEGNAEPKPLPQHRRIFCFQGSQSFSPASNGNIYWQRWDTKARATSADSGKDSTEHDLQFHCREAGNGDLKCDEGDVPNFFGRIAHHLFFSLMVPDEATRQATLASELIRRSLGESLYSRTDQPPTDH